MFKNPILLRFSRSNYILPWQMNSTLIIIAYPLISWYNLVFLVFSRLGDILPFTLSWHIIAYLGILLNKNAVQTVVNSPVIQHCISSFYFRLSTHVTFTLFL